jgi:hypothetical protein
VALAILTVVSACGGGGNDGGPPKPPTVSTLAYVVSDCRDDANSGGTLRQYLQIQQGDQAPITVAETPAIGLTGSTASAFCADFGFSRQASNVSLFGVFQRLGVTPDGSEVVFEVTEDLVPHVIAFPPNMLPDEQEGIFAVHADGTGLRRLGPASRESPYQLERVAGVFTAFAFSPNGRTIAYADHGPSRDNQDATQIFALDLDTGGPRQLTQLPPATPFGACCPVFTDDETITFLSYADADGTNPDGENIFVTVKTDGTGLTVSPPPVAIPGSHVLPSYQITGAKVSAAIVRLPDGIPLNDPAHTRDIQEVFVIDGDNALQLTNYRREDTWGPSLSADGERVFFSAAVDELGTNPTQNCQVFSIDRTGDDLRQLTNFSEGNFSSAGCHSAPRGLGCTVFLTDRDVLSDSLVFFSTCDPFGTNPYGFQLFTMHQDGTGLRQLTTTRGVTIEENGVRFEAPFPFAFPGRTD